MGLSRRHHSRKRGGPQPAEEEPAEGLLPQPCELRSGGLGHQPMPSQPQPYLNIPVPIQVIDAGDAAPVAVGIVNMPHVPEPIAWVTRHHGLAEMEEGGLLRSGRDTLRKQANHSCPKSVLYHLRLWEFQPKKPFSSFSQIPSSSSQKPKLFSLNNPHSHLHPTPEQRDSMCK